MKATHNLVAIVGSLAFAISTVAVFAAATASSFSPTIPNKAPAPGRAPAGMVWIPGGVFSMGSDDPTTEGVCGGHEQMRDARPIHRVYVDGFWMDKTEVTNEQFAKFVAATGYKTIAEI